MRKLVIIISTYIFIINGYSQPSLNENINELSQDIINSVIKEKFKRDTLLKWDTIYSVNFPRKVLFGPPNGYRGSSSYYFLFGRDTSGKVREVLEVKEEIFQCHYFLFYIDKYPNYIFLSPQFYTPKYKFPFTKGIIVFEANKFESYFIGYNQYVNSPFPYKKNSDYHINDLFILDNFLLPIKGYRFYNSFLVTFSKYKYDDYEIVENYFLLKQNNELNLSNFNLLKLKKFNISENDYYIQGEADIKSKLYYPFWMKYPNYKIK